MQRSVSPYPKVIQYHQMIGANMKKIVFNPTTITIGISLITVFLAFVGRQMFNWCRSTISLKSKPVADIALIRATHSYVNPNPMIRVAIKDVEVFTRQPDGQFWMTAELTLPNKEKMKFKLYKTPYEHYMDLTPLWFNAQSLADWTFWDNDGQILKQSTLTTILFINDRKCLLTKNQKPIVTFLDQ